MAISASETGTPPKTFALGTVDFSETITWKLFNFFFSKERIVSLQVRKWISYRMSMALATRCLEHWEVEKGIQAIESMPEASVDVVASKFLVYLYLSKRPKDIEAAKKVLAMFADRKRIEKEYKQVSSLTRLI